VPGVGKNHKWTVNVTSQASPVSSATSSYATPTISSLSPVVFPTVGATEITITGSGFGPLSTSPVWSALSATIVASYGTTGTEYVASNCNVTIADTTMVCVSVAGSGQNHAWKVNISTQASPLSSVLTRYNSPSILQVNSTVGPIFSTLGSESVTITGINFGLVGGLTPVSLVYTTSSTLSYTATACSVTIAHTTMVCTTVAGAGNSMSWQVTVNTQSSTSFSSGGLLRYATPSISSFSVVKYPTNGGTLITITGLSFGPSSTPVSRVSVTYGPSGVELNATSCQGMNVFLFRLHAEVDFFLCVACLLYLCRGSFDPLSLHDLSHKS
jgi:fructose-specific phosphotransferase system component IIB